jgi:hypothetical protein
LLHQFTGGDVRANYECEAWTCEVPISCDQQQQRAGDSERQQQQRSSFQRLEMMLMLMNAMSMPA